MTSSNVSSGNGQPKQSVAPPVSRLSAVKKGKLKTPLRHVYFGVEGVGKSTLAAHAPEPIWFDMEDGSSRLNVSRYLFRDDGDGHVPRSYREVLAGIDDLTRNEHGFKTLVIDTVDRLEPLIWKYMIERDTSKFPKGLENIESYGYGRGYQVAVDEWRAFCSRLDALRVARGVDIVLLAHAQVRLFKSPDTDDYERYNLQLNEKAAGFIKGWADIVGFCRFEENAGKAPGATRVKGYSTGRRLLNLVRTAAYDAKGRGGMPAEIELDPSNPWAPIQKAIDDAESMTPAALVALIGAETVRINDPEITKRVEAVVAKVGNDTDTLNRMLQQLKRQDGKAVA